MAELLVPADVSGTVWKVQVEVGQQVQAEDELMILESMKMEIPVHAPRAGRVDAVLSHEKDVVTEGQPLVRLSY